MDYGISGQSIVCLGGEDWWYHHPHSKYHLLKRFATANKVLFVNSITMGLPNVSNPDFFLKIRRKFRSYLRWLRFAPEGLWVMTPVNLPSYHSHMMRRMNRILVLVQLRLAMLLLGMSRPVLWIAIPSGADLTGSLGEKLLLYQVSDKYDANEDSALSGKAIREMDCSLKSAADIVLYSGRKLFQEATELNRYYLEQAVDFEHFARLPLETAAEVQEVPHPVLGYFGAMDYVMDADLIEEVARLRPEWHWILIGLRSNLVRISARNVHFIDPKPYRELPRYIAQFDVCVLPWRHDNAFTSYGSAIKVREYLATGKPVVIAPLFEYLHTAGLRIYHSTAEFIECIEDALAADTSEKAMERQNAVRECTWDVRARELGTLIDFVTGGNTYQFNAPSFAGDCEVRPDAAEAVWPADHTAL